MSKIKETINFQDKALAQWLGAIFETEGSMSFSRQLTPTGKSKKLYARPIIKLTNKNQLAMAKVKTMLGDTTLHPNKIEITKNRAVKIAKFLQPYIPSRNVVIPYFEWWKEAFTSEEKYQAALAFLENSNKTPAISIEAYQELLTLPAFVSGLLDFSMKPINRQFQEKNRYNDGYHSRHRVGFQLYTKKYELLVALQRTFLGSSPIPHHGIFLWEIQGRDSQALLEFCLPYLKILQLPEPESEPA